MRPLILLATALFLSSCSTPTNSKSATTSDSPRQLEHVKPRDETRRFPIANQTSTKVIDDHILDKAFMPGGTIAHYKKGKVEYDMFLAKMPSASDAAIVLPDWRKALTDSKLIPSFGGYYGTDNGRPVFVFPKGAWIAGIAGLPEKDADLQARTLATKIE